MLQLVCIMVAALGFCVAGVRMLLVRPKWTSGNNSEPGRLWVAMTALMAVMVIVSMRDFAVVEAENVSSLYGLLIRVAKVLAVGGVLWALFHREEVTA